MMQGAVLKEVEVQNDSKYVLADAKWSKIGSKSDVDKRLETD